MSTAALLSFDTGRTPLSLAIGDLDGEGKPDTSFNPCAEASKWIAVGRTIQVSVQGTDMLRGPFQRVAGDTLYLRTNKSERYVAVSRIKGLWTQGNSSKKGLRYGAVIGGIAGAVLGVFAAGLAQGLDDKAGGKAYGGGGGAYVGGAAVGGVLGAGAGALFGAVIGASITRWEIHCGE